MCPKAGEKAVPFTRGMISVRPMARCSKSTSGSVTGAVIVCHAISTMPKLNWRIPTGNWTMQGIEVFFIEIFIFYIYFFIFVKRLVRVTINC